MSAKAKKSKLYFFAIVSYSCQARFTFFHYSNTPSLSPSRRPILQIQLTSAFDKKANKCSLPAAMIYTPFRYVLYCI